jgi:hypothetical protein
LVKTSYAFPTPLQQDADPIFDLILETVVEVVVHLTDEVFVIERLEVNIVISHRVAPRGFGREGCAPRPGIFFPSVVAKIANSFVRFPVFQRSRTKPPRLEPMPQAPRKGLIHQIDK